MRKKLEAELISIAHRILQLKHKDDVRELHHETQKLYEKLSVLLFVEENFSDVKPTIGIHEIEQKLEKAFDFDEKIVVAELKEEEEEGESVVSSKAAIDPSETITEEKAEPAEEIIAEEPKTEIEMPKAEEVIEEPKETIAEKPKPETKTPIIEIPKPDKKQISFDEILGGFQPDPIFERVSDVKKTEETKMPVEVSKIDDEKIEEKNTTNVTLETAFLDIKEPKDVFFEKADPKPAANLNDKLNKGINIGLNDRIAFEKNLFGGSSADFNRVVSQLSTFDTLEDAKNFIEEMVKPDYNDWKGKDEFAARFMEFVENKFV
jgi:hypothetical protein